MVLIALSGVATNFVAGWKAYTSQGEKTQSDESEETKEELLAQLPNVQEGENLPLDHGAITQHKTKPKPLFTEATLLSAMENAGREIEDTDTRKAISDCGIGTPATRASIIETLLLRDFIRREKKTLLPHGKRLIPFMASSKTNASPMQK